jgi:hypothetical protein
MINSVSLNVVGNLNLDPMQIDYETHEKVNYKMIFFYLNLTVLSIDNKLQD